MISKPANFILLSTVLLATVSGVVVWHEGRLVEPAAVTASAKASIPVATKLENQPTAPRIPVQTTGSAAVAEKTTFAPPKVTTSIPQERLSISSGAISGVIENLANNVNQHAAETIQSPPEPARSNDSPVARMKRSMPSSSVISSFTIDPATPGAALKVGETNVVVESYEPSPHQSSPALAVAITETPQAESEPQPVATVVTKPASKQIGTMSYEDQLFRMKWGWAAYEATRKAALEPPPATN